MAAPKGKPGYRGPGRAGYLLHTGDFIQIDTPSCVGRNIGQFNHFHAQPTLGKVETFPDATWLLKKYQALGVARLAS
jgi:hypothetical protein